MWIGGTPTIKIKNSKPNNNKFLPFPLNNNVWFFYSARYALYYALKALELGAGDGILAPSYCCGTEIDPILALGCEIKWYPVKDKLIPDINFIKEQWNHNIKGILVTHYLGFNCLKDDLSEFCRENNILIIEDCAHAFLSNTETGQPLGSTGDASVFSIRKTLPIPDGGCLFLRETKHWPLNFSLQPPGISSILFRILELFSETSTPRNGYAMKLSTAMLRYFGKGGELIRIFFRLIRKLFGGFENLFIDPNSYVFSDMARKWRISDYSRNMLNYFDWNRIKKTRRSNYIFLLEQIGSIQRVRVLFDNLPDGVCPLFFPIIVDNRMKLHNFLKKRGIDSHLWWGYFHPSVPWDSFPRSVELKNKLLGLPIHQDLGKWHMDKIIGALKEALS